jgi:putative peptidoglycan lipid II flippase
MIKRLLNNNLLLNAQPSKSVVSAAFVITIAGLASRLLGLLRDRMLASTFGAGDVLDVYYAAFRIPDFIYNILVLGALSAAFIPVFTSLISKEKEGEAWRLANSLLNFGLIFVITVSAVLAIFAPWLMRLLTPGFSPEKMESVVMFTRIMFLSPLFLGISGIFGGILTSFKRFLVYSLAPIMYNLGIVVGVLFFVKFWGPIGLAWGVVFGSFLHMLSQYPAARHLGFRYAKTAFTAVKDPAARKVFSLMIPRIMGIAVSQVNLMVITIFASTLAAGSLAIFNFAQNLQGVPLGLFGVSFAIAVFPVLSAHAAREENDEFVKNFSSTFRHILFFVIPFSVFILVLRAQIVRVFLGAGQFDWEDTILTFQCLGIFSLSLFSQSTVPLLARAFYALHDTKAPFYVALASEAVNILAVLLLIGKYEILGLAIAFSLASAVQMLIMLFLLRARFDSLDDRRIFRSVGKIATASFAAGLAVQGVKYAVAAYTDLDTFLGIFLQLALSSAAGLFIFIACAYLFRIEEFFHFKNSLTKRLFKQKGLITEDTSDVSGI